MHPEMYLKASKVRNNNQNAKIKKFIHLIFLKSTFCSGLCREVISKCNKIGPTNFEQFATKEIPPNKK